MYLHDSCYQSSSLFLPSLGIIMCEVLTMEAPFQECLDYVEVKDVLDAIAGRKSLSSELPASLLRGNNEIFQTRHP